MATARKNPKAQRASRRSWEMTTLPERIARQVGIDCPLPVPGREVARVQKGTFSFHELAQWIQNHLEEHPDHPDQSKFQDVALMLVRLHHSTQLLSAGRPAEARAVLEELLKDQPDNGLALLNLADCHNVQGEHEKALEIASTLVERLGANLRLLILRSRALIALKRRAEAVRLLRDALAAAPGNTTIRAELVRINELIPVSLDPARPAGTQFVDRPSYRKTALERVNGLLAGGKFAEALSVVTQLNDARLSEIAAEAAALILAKVPGSAETLHAAGLAAAHQDQNEQAEAHFRAALKLKPASADTRIALAQVLGRTERLDEARSLLHAVLAENANNVSAAEMLILLEQGDDAQLAAARALGEKHPDSWAVKKLLGDLDFRLGDVEDALARHREAYDKSGNDDALTMVLHDLDRLDRTEEAIRLLDSVPVGTMKGGPVRWNAANIYLKAGRVKPAIVLLEGMVRDRRLPHETRLSALNLLGEVRQSVQGRR